MKLAIADAYNQIVETGHAEPTSRLIPQPYTDGQEWSAAGRLGGMSVLVYYFFDADESDVDDADQLPWDEEHCVRITDKDGVDIVMGQRLPGFADYYTGERDSEVMGAIKMASAEEK